jgi:Plasmid replication region DNA-binding N-term
MTLDDVRAAVASLQEEGLYPSHRALLARLGGGEHKSAIAVHLRTLRAADPAALPPARSNQNPLPQAAPRATPPPR